jgi:hypothetical protein
MEESKDNYHKDIYTLYETLLKGSEKFKNCEEIKKKIEDNKEKVLIELKINNDYIMKRKKN